MIEDTIVKLLGYGVFWSVRSRYRFRTNLRGLFRRLKKFVFHSSIVAVPRSQGERLLEHRIRICGIPLFARRWQRAKYRIALLVDEFFGGWDTAIGGYGALARKYICKYIPNDQIQIDILMNTHARMQTEQKLVDQTMIYSLPWGRKAREKWLDEQAYNLFLSIEMTESSFRILSEYETSTRLLYWIQDPRDLKMYQSRLRTVQRLRDSDWSYIKDVAIWMQGLMDQRRVSFISQGEALSEIARKMYEIPTTVAIRDLPNPVEIDGDYELNASPKENKIIFLGRLEAQKRVWIVCEIAKAMPQHEFYILGATGKGREEAANAKSLEEYRNQDGSSRIKNLHFQGHVDGDLKNFHIKSARLVLNTSIWEGIPVSWLEALSYGTLIVSAFERDNIVGRFGTYVGEVLGDGTDEATVRRFTDAISYWMTHDSERIATAQKAIQFIRSRHSIPEFTKNMRSAIFSEIQ